MRSATCSLVFLEAGRPVHAVPVSLPKVTLGRSPDCGVVLVHSSVSRRHAEIELHDGHAQIRDLGARNELRVNGVPRRRATLHDGDMIELGQQALQFRTTFVALPLAPSARATMALDPHPSIELIQRFPAEWPQRHLLTLYHVCAWLAETDPSMALYRRIMRLLLEGLGVREAQLYSFDGQLEHVESCTQEPTGLKFAAYLAKRFQAATEATSFPAAELGRFQPRAGDFNALVFPLRLSADSERAFSLVLLRPRDWEPFNPQDRVLAQAISHVMALGPRQAGEWRQTLEAPVAATVAPAEEALLGQSRVMTALRAQVRRVAVSRATVLITGESGSGKEAVARQLHADSAAADGPFVIVNCAALPVMLVESELFGHTRGAFTDAKEDQPGKFALAQGGTLFLDEVGELPLPAQAKLLRALETGEIERLGSSGPVRVEVRVLAATNRPLADLVAAGEFRLDLYHRLNVVPVAVPPLREHLEDVEVLARHFLHLFGPERPMDFSPHALKLLTQERWPGNVRALRNVLQRCVVYAEGDMITSSLVRRCLAM